MPPEGVAIVGENAQGKSNFLEAIYYLETLRSFRGARENEMVGFGADVFRVQGTLTEQAGPRDIAAAYQRTGKRKKVTVDGAEVERIGDGVGHLGAVVFSPLDTALVSEGPGERRRFLDIVLALHWPGYMENLQRYRRVLAQRNAALREGSPAVAVEIWNRPLAEAGAAVTAARAGWCRQRGEAYARYYLRISGRGEASLEYRPALGSGTEVSEEVLAVGGEALRDRFLEGLKGAMESDQRLGSTSVGPHRDDLRLRVRETEKELDLRKYGSGGQRRTAALALRLVEADTIRDALQREPLVLLDDAFAELDEGRSQRILELLEAEEKGQVILTAPKEADIRFRRDRLERRTIRAGVLSP